MYMEIMQYTKRNVRYHSVIQDHMAIHPDDAVVYDSTVGEWASSYMLFSMALSQEDKMRLEVCIPCKAKDTQACLEEYIDRAVNELEYCRGSLVDVYIEVFSNNGISKGHYFAMDVYLDDVVKSGLRG